MNMIYTVPKILHTSCYQLRPTLYMPSQSRRDLPAVGKCG